MNSDEEFGSDWTPTMDVDLPGGTPAPMSSRIMSPAEAHELLTREMTQPSKKQKAAESGQDGRGSTNPPSATRDGNPAQALDKVKAIVGGMKLSLNSLVNMARNNPDDLEAHCEAGNLLNWFEILLGQITEVTSSLDSYRPESPAKSLCDASTDTVLTPSWWDSDKAIEARAASRRRQARKTIDATQQHARSAATEDDTAMETDAGGTWAEVAGRRKVRRKKTGEAAGGTPVTRAPLKPPSVARKPPAILVKPGAGKSFADTVRAVRSCGLNAKDMGASVSMRETRDGSLLLELPKGAKSAAAAKTIAEALGSKLEDSVGKVSQLGVQVEMEVLDLDAVSSAAEVLEALRTAIPGGEDPAAVAEREAISDIRIWPVRGGQQVATVKMSRYAASVLTKVPVGWTMCRVRPRTRGPERCFRCQAFGHNARNCTGQVDRTGACWRCGERGHPMKDCKAGEDRCLACEMAGLARTSHRPGSGACAARRKQMAGKETQSRPTPTS